MKIVFCRSRTAMYSIPCLRVPQELHSSRELSGNRGIDGSSTVFQPNYIYIAALNGINSNWSGLTVIIRLKPTSRSRAW